MKHIVIDVESLSVAHNAVITQVAAIAIEMVPHSGAGAFRPGHEFKMNLKIEEQIRKGGMIDSDTMQWWLRQDRKVFEECFTDPMAPYPFCRALNLWFCEQIHAEEEYLVWASDPLLDFGSIVRLHAQCGMPMPWNHRQQRDARTLRGLVAAKQRLEPSQTNSVKVEPQRPHDALSDALALAAEISRNYLALGLPL